MVQNLMALFLSVKLVSYYTSEVSGNKDNVLYNVVRNSCVNSCNQRVSCNNIYPDPKMPRSFYFL